MQHARDKPQNQSQRYPKCLYQCPIRGALTKVTKYRCGHFSDIHKVHVEEDWARKQVPTGLQLVTNGHFVSSILTCIVHSKASMGKTWKNMQGG